MALKEKMVEANRLLEETLRLGEQYCDVVHKCHREIASVIHELEEKNDLVDYLRNNSDELQEQMAELKATIDHFTYSFEDLKSQ